MAAGQQTVEFLIFVGQVAMTALGVLAHPSRMRWRTTLLHMQMGGFDALAIIGLMSFLLGVVVAYQGADQLRN